MTDRAGDGLAIWMEQRLLRRWSEIADRAGRDGLTRDEHARALALTQRLDRALRAAGKARTGTPVLPAHTDWWWRPDAWSRLLLPGGVAAKDSETRFSDDVSVFHDGPGGEVLVRQTRNVSGAAKTDYGLAVDVFRFGGSYLSLVFDIPRTVTAALRKRHVIRLETGIETERPTEILGRLNIQHGPNTERLVRELPFGDTRQTVDFDLAITRVDTSRVGHMWLDLIFERPHMNGLRIADFVLSRQPRAEL